MCQIHKGEALALPTPVDSEKRDYRARGTPIAHVLGTHVANPLKHNEHKAPK